MSHRESTPDTSNEDDVEDDPNQDEEKHTEPLIKIEILDRLPSPPQEEDDVPEDPSPEKLHQRKSKLVLKNVAKAAVNMSSEDRVRQYPKGTLHVDPVSRELVCTRCNVVLDHTRKGSIDKHLKAQMHVKNLRKKEGLKKEVVAEREEGEVPESTPGKISLYVSCETRVRQYPEGTLHVDPDTGDLMCSTCNVIMDHTRKGSIDKHLLAKSHIKNSAKPAAPKRNHSVLRVNTFQKYHAKRPKVKAEDDQPFERVIQASPKTSNSVSKAAIKVTPAERVAQYPAGMLHVEDDSTLFCSICNVSLDHTRKGSIDKHLRTQLHTEKHDRQQRLKEARERRQSAAVGEGFSRTTDARDGRNLALFRLVEAFTAAEIPLHKLDHPKLRDYLAENVSNLGALPSSARLRVGYLPKVREALRREKEQKMAALDETIDSVRIDSLTYLIHGEEQ
uniref:Putative p20-cggbp n=1 Tax=Culex tarsalis TaxID=7177 RepID=A0A1Q3EZH5_CULTA